MFDKKNKTKKRKNKNKNQHKKNVQRTGGPHHHRSQALLTPMVFLLGITYVYKVSMHLVSCRVRIAITLSETQTYFHPSVFNIRFQSLRALIAVFAIDLHSLHWNI